MYKIGEKVVCIDDSKVSYYGIIFPKKGNEYTVRGFYSYNGKTGIYLEEIKNKKYDYVNGLMEPSFLVSRFRPLQELSETTYNEVMEWMTVETLNLQSCSN